jgi:diaminohydroxyphosphoribosylaminopyrimidine deaminase/5-amino-6-(5-phosphoribosylamino)uracil reductase
MTNKAAIDYCIKLAKNANEREICPNPYVGAIIVDQNGMIKGEGYHQKLGGAHAEVFAIEEALLNKTDLSTATLYVSLEPCSHFGKTPPCCDLIIQNRIQKVVIGSLDPNPKVESIEKLKNAGIEVEVEIAPDAITLNRRFFTQHLKHRPYFILKTASTVDGKIADYEGSSKWISHSKSRAFVHDPLRTNVDAILSTYKTVLQDQAVLNIRKENEPAKETNVIIIDRSLKLLDPANADLPIFYERKNTILYFVTDTIPSIVFPKYIKFIKGQFDENGLQFSSIHKQLLESGIYTILTEGGSKLNSSLIAQNSADELYWFIAPKLLNDTNSSSMFGHLAHTLLTDAIQLKLISSSVIEEDVLLHYYFKQDQY